MSIVLADSTRKWPVVLGMPKANPNQFWDFYLLTRGWSWRQDGTAGWFHKGHNKKQFNTNEAVIF